MNVIVLKLHEYNIVLPLNKLKINTEKTENFLLTTTLVTIQNTLAQSFNTNEGVVGKF